MLTARERDVLTAMVAGQSREEIADQLEISANTVRTHMQNILSKLGVHSSLAAVAVARRAGLA
jgi:DNA-binding NarL/FixJ family response regulator